ncbi:hypothetical protein E1287_17635 [Actinomadura sp. KC06]|uniref:hypothetical protein n=1 Tax=Actinomadura sp. KC06 TaxID=2530369 RepID=UPI001053EB09|nr:hypothetical protein [Actinomadura sp. KC06]TDD34166.1 hypothetical protein E1287_17635 [Actinomadura sp. KC06]
MGQERFQDRREFFYSTSAPPSTWNPFIPATQYLREKLDRRWVRRRMKGQVDDLMRHTLKLQEAAALPDPLVPALRTARTAIHSLRTELDVWGLLEVRPGQSGAAVEVLLELDIVKELGRHGIGLAPSIAERLKELRRRLRRERIQSAPLRRDDDGSGGDGGAGLKELLDLALTVIDELLEDADPDDTQWRERAGRVLHAVVDLLSNLVVATAAVGLTVLAVDDTLNKEVTKKVIEILTGMIGLEVVRAARSKTAAPDIAAVLHAADSGVRTEARNLLTVTRRISSQRGRPSHDHLKAKKALACLRGHVFTVERLLELGDTDHWPESDGYLEVCKRLNELAREAVDSLKDTSTIGRWRMRRGVMAKLDRAVVELATFQVPDTLPPWLPSRIFADGRPQS